MPPKTRLPKENEPIPANAIIQFKDQAIGAIQTIEIVEKDENGNTLEYPQATAYRVRFDKEAIDELFGGHILTVQAQTYPFDIEISGGEKPGTLRNCWILEFPFAHHTSDLIILDEMRIEMETFISR